MMHKNQTIRTARSGFSLIEMLVVMAIIAILMTLMVGVFSVSTRSGDEAKAKSELAGLMNELEKYFADEGAYPADWDEFATWYDARYPGTIWDVTSNGTADEPIDPWEEPYVYTPGPTPFVYFIGSKGLDQTGDTPDDITNRNGALN